VVAGLKEGWSPEQVAGRIKEKKLGSISYETIYQFVYEQTGEEDLRPLLKRRHKARQQKGVRRWQRLPNPNKPSIETRPEIVSARSRLGDWEGDLVVSRESKSALVTLVERKSGYLCVEKIASKTVQYTAGVMARRLKGAKTLTLDNGSENNGWKRIEEETGAKVYFAHPYSSWERGTNENTNGLIRWYLPKKTDFALVSASRIRDIEYALNNRPRKRLGYKTPEEVFNS
jgi:IS30 family transposase